MAVFEYNVVPAPAKGVKARGVKTPEARFAHALQELMNEMGADGWEYQRADTLPSTERSGLTGSVTQWRHVLVFRRALPEAAAPAPAPEPILKQEVTPQPPAPKQAPAVPDKAATPPPVAQGDEDPKRPAGQPGATQMLNDNGVEETSEVSGLTTSLQTLAKNRKSPFGSDT